MTHYRRHVFMCVNHRDEGDCCANHNSEARLKYLRHRLKAQGLHGKGRIRVNKSGCMDRCAEGPILVIYPDAVWYRYESESDLDEIADRHLQNGEIIERLKI